MGIPSLIHVIGACTRTSLIKKNDGFDPLTQKKELPSMVPMECRLHNNTIILGSAP